MKKQFLITLSLILSATFLTLHAQDWNEIINVTASDGTNGDEYGYRVAIDGDYAIVSGRESGATFILMRSGNSWVEQTKLIASDADGGDGFGNSVDINGDYAIVGTPRADTSVSSSGAAYIFFRSGTTWTEQAKLEASDPGLNDQFGASVSIDGNYAIVGAFANNDGGGDTGSAYIFVRSGTNWLEQDKLTAPIPENDDWFGYSVDINGDYAIVGAFQEDDFGASSGSAYVFVRSGTSWLQQAKLNATNSNAGDVFGFSVAIDGDYAIIGSHGSDANGNNSGSAYIFLRSGTTWSQQVKLDASDAAAGDLFGYNVAIAGDRVIVGAYRDSDAVTSSGSAYIFTRTGTSWTEDVKLTASDAVLNDFFGYSVAIDGNYAVVGAYGNDDAGFDAGSAYFFEQTVPPPAPQDWNEIIEATASDAATSDAFGYSVAIDGDYAIVGARSNDDDGTNSGSAYIFVRSGGNWIEQAKLTASDATSEDQFGFSVSISGDYAIVGALGNDDTGSAYIFMRSGTNWTEQTKLTALDASTDAGFGGSVSINGDYAIVGAYGDNNGSGSAYIFIRSGTNWTEQTKLTATDAAASDQFGRSVTVDGNFAIVGAWVNDDDGTSSGSAYIFERIGTTWTEQSKLRASDAAAGDLFGFSVALDGDYAIVGAYGNDDAGNYSGSAYIFMRSGTNWAEQIKLTASDAASTDVFGWSVSIEGDYAIVGAFLDDDVATDSGSAYIFMNTGNTWVEQNKLTASNASSGAQFGYSVDLDGNYAVIGARFGDGAVTDSGSAYFFEQTVAPPPAPQDWNEIIEATASDAGAGDQFGYSVAIDGDYAIVGARFDDDDGANSGSAYILVRSGGNWTEQAKLTASDATSDDFFGVSVSISGDYAIVGGFGNDDTGNFSGSAYIFMRSGTNWTEQTKLTALDASTDARFGGSVSINGDYAIVGAYGDNNASGSAYIFIRSGTNWTEQTKLTATDGEFSDLFGYSVSIEGNYAIVGAVRDNDVSADSGSAYIFERLGTNWTEQAKLKASDASMNDRFGFSVSIEGDFAIVGAFLDDDTAVDSGSAYIFERSGTNWIQQIKLTAFDATGGDRFGISVSIDGEYAIVGSHEDDDFGAFSGSAYIFMNTGSTWVEQTKLTASDANANASFGWSVALDGNYAVIGAPFGDGAVSDSGSVYFFGPDTPAVTYTFNSGWSPSDPNGIATSNDAIVIASGDAIISTSTNSNTFTVNPGASITINTGAVLTVNDGLTLESDATTFSSLILDGTVNGTMNYQRHVNGNTNLGDVNAVGNNDLVAAPFTGQTFGSFAADNANLLENPADPTEKAFAIFDKPFGLFSNYNTLTNAGTTLDPGVGYRAASNNTATLTFTGTTDSGAIDVDIINSGTAFARWNLVGNPYPSYINIQAFLSHVIDSGPDPDITNLSLFEAGSAAIYGFNGTDYTIYNLSSTTPSSLMAPGQGFFVSADATYTGLYDLEFRPSMRSTGSANDFISRNAEELIYVKINAHTNTKSYNTDFYFNSNSSLGFDLGYDAVVWGENPPAFSIYSHLVQDNSGQPIALQSLNSTELSDVTIPLGINANQGEQITIGILEGSLPESVNVYLDDTVSNRLALLNDSDYVVSPETDLSGTGRFFLRFSSVVLSTLEPNLETLNIYVLDSSKELIVRGELEENTRLNLYDIQGRNVLSKRLESSQIENRIDVSALSGGVYVVNLQNVTGQKSQKVILR